MSTSRDGHGDGHGDGFADSEQSPEKTRSKSSLAGGGRRRRKAASKSPEFGAKGPSGGLPKLNVTTRMELLSMDPKRVSRRQPHPPSRPTIH